MAHKRGRPLAFVLLGLAVLAVWGASMLWDRKGALAAGERPLNPPLLVRLERYRNQPAVPLQMQGDWRVLAFADGRVLQEGTNFQGELRAEERGIVLGFWVLETRRILIETSGDAAMRIGDHGYRGRLLVEALGEPLPEKLELKLELPLEDYVLGVVCGEMPTTAAGASEALKAQAVAARTYALWRLGNRERDFLRDDPSDQRFHGVDFETAAAREAVAATRGQVLAWDDEILPAYFHAACGGRTADGYEADFVSRETPPLAGVEDPGCRRAVGWRHTVPAEVLDEFARDFGLGPWIGRLAAERVQDSGRWSSARVEGPDAARVVNGARLATVFGTPSRLWTRVRGREDGSLEVEGAGRGHGVGLCQEGALEHARAGWNFQHILRHYYPGARLEHLTELPRGFP